MAFGYSDQVMARMGSIPRDAANAAAAAYRAGEMRTVNGDGTANGALVAPLLTADGCIGVLSAEMKGGSEKDESSQALASIFAAQLATLVSPPASAALAPAPKPPTRSGRASPRRRLTPPQLVRGQPTVSRNWTFLGKNGPFRRVFCGTSFGLTVTGVAPVTGLRI